MYLQPLHVCPAVWNNDRDSCPTFQLNRGPSMTPARSIHDYAKNARLMCIIWMFLCAHELYVHLTA